MIRMLIVGYCTGIRSERRLCEEVHLNLTYRRFSRLGLNGRFPITDSLKEPAWPISRQRGAASFNGAWRRVWSAPRPLETDQCVPRRYGW
jgi:hypothetical protein